MNNDEALIWEAPKIVPPELRLYYDDQGHVLFYTCEKPEGNYIVIDVETYAEGRHDIRVIDGKLSYVNTGAHIVKLVPAIEGKRCLSEDISIVSDTDNDITYWKLKTYELR